MIVASSEDELPALQRLYRRGLANGVPGLERIGPRRLGELEPHARGVAAIHSPTTGIISFRAVAQKCAEILIARGKRIWTGAQVVGLSVNASSGGGCRVQTSRGVLESRLVINCAGLFSDRIAAWTGIAVRARIVPFRGEYYRIRPEKRYLVRNLIYPVPDPRFPFLGAHFTRRIDGEIEAGPNAVLALAREGYRPTDLRLADLGPMLAYPGFWKMARRYWRTGLGELYRSFVKPAFVRDLRRLVPAIECSDLIRGGSGVRAQAVDERGSLLDDFEIARSGGAIHVLNAPSPAATSAFAIAERILELAR